MAGDIRQPSHLDPEQDVEYYGVGYKAPSSHLEYNMWNIMVWDIRQPSHLDPEQDVEYYGVGYKAPSSHLDPEQDVGYKIPSSLLGPEQDVEYYGGRYKAAFASGPRAGCGILWCGI